MRCFTLWAVLPAALALAQVAESPAVSRARQELDRAKQLVSQGVLPPARLQEAQHTLDDARDEDVLDAMLYGRQWADLTEEQAGEMVAAAARRRERAQKSLERSRGLIADGAAAENDLGPLERELERRRQVESLAEGRSKLLRESAGMARVEADAARRAAADAAVEDAAAHPLVERFNGAGAWSFSEIDGITLAYEKQFHKPMPVSAEGETAVHRLLGLDHRGRVDVALNPDQPEGVWLRRYLASRGIPYFAFRAALRGQATGPHIHIGPGSTRLRPSD